MENTMIALATFAIAMGKRILGALLAYGAGRYLIRRILALLEKSRGYRRMEPSVQHYAHSAAQGVLFVILAISIVGILGVPMASVLTVLASAGVAVGLALQGSLSNLAGGIMLMIFRPFREGDYVVGAARAIEGKSVLTITEKGYGKRTPVEEYRITNRGGLGIKNYQITDKTGKIVGVKVVDGTEDLLLMTQSGILIRTPVENIKETANRATQGVIVMRFKEDGDQVISMALAEHEDTEDVSAEAEISTEISANEENSTTET